MKNLPVVDPGHVANCAATDCQHNQARVCRAPQGIQIIFHGDHADCVTYTRNRHSSPA